MSHQGIKSLTKLLTTLSTPEATPLQPLFAHQTTEYLSYPLLPSLSAETSLLKYLISHQDAYDLPTQPSKRASKNSADLSLEFQPFADDLSALALLDLWDALTIKTESSSAPSPNPLAALFAERASREASRQRATKAAEQRAKALARQEAIAKDPAKAEQRKYAAEMKSKMEKEKGMKQHVLASIEADEISRKEQAKLLRLRREAAEEKKRKDEELRELDEEMGWEDEELESENEIENEETKVE